MIAPLRETTAAERAKKRRLYRARRVVASAMFDGDEPHRAAERVSHAKAWLAVAWMLVCSVAYFVQVAGWWQR